MGYLAAIYVVYVAVSVGLTVWLARTLHRHGAVFLETVFDEPHLARAVNALLVTGFFMVNLGYAFLILRTDIGSATAIGAVESLVAKLGVLLVSLGVVHFVNMAVFFRLRRRRELSEMTAPVAPHGYAEPAAWPAAPQ